MPFFACLSSCVWKLLLIYLIHPGLGVREENEVERHLIITELRNLSPSLLLPLLLLLLLLLSLWNFIPHLQFPVCLEQQTIFSFSITFLPAAFWIKSTFSHGFVRIRLLCLFMLHIQNKAYCSVAVKNRGSINPLWMNYSIYSLTINPHAYSA